MAMVGERYGVRDMEREIAFRQKMDEKAKALASLATQDPVDVSQEFTNYVDYTMLLAGFQRCPNTQVGTCYQAYLPEKSHISHYYSHRIGDTIEKTTIDEPAHDLTIKLNLEQGYYQYCVDSNCVTSGYATSAICSADYFSAPKEPHIPAGAKLRY